MSWLKEAVGALQRRVENDAACQAAETAKGREHRSILRRIEEEERRLKAERQAQAREGLNLLRSSGVKALMEEVRRDVWKGGKLEEQINKWITGTPGWSDKRYGLACLRLVHGYKRIVPEGYLMGPASGVGYYPPKEVEEEEELTVGIDKDAFGGHTLILRSFIWPEGLRLSTREPEPGFLHWVKKFLEKDSVERVRARRLPQDLVVVKGSESLDHNQIKQGQLTWYDINRDHPLIRKA